MSHSSRWVVCLMTEYNEFVLGVSRSKLIIVRIKLISCSMLSLLCISAMMLLGQSQYQLRPNSPTALGLFIWFRMSEINFSGLQMVGRMMSFTICSWWLKLSYCYPAVEASVAEQAMPPIKLARTTTLLVLHCSRNKSYEYPNTSIINHQRERRKFQYGKIAEYGQSCQRFVACWASPVY